MAKHSDSIDEIYLVPYEDLEDTNQSFSISRSKIEVALNKSKATGLSNNSNPSVQTGNIKTREKNYENIDETTGVHFSAQRKNIHDETIREIYFTPENVLDEPPQLRQAARSHQNDNRKSRYDSQMYALPDSPTGSTKTSMPPPDSSPPPSPSEQGKSMIQRCCDCNRRTITIIIVLSFFVLVSSGAGVVIALMSQTVKGKKL